MTSIPSTQTEDAYEGKIKCNVCSHKENEHRLGKDICLRHGCDCMSFAKKGMPTVLTKKWLP
jgi:hypothetical protein